MKYEFQKIFRQRALIFLTVVGLVAVYVFLAFRGSMETLCGTSISYFWADEDYRQYQMLQATEAVDETWIESMKEEYKAFVDANMLSSEEIRDRLASWEGESMTVEDVLRDPYNVQNAGFVLEEDAFFSPEMEYRYFAAFNNYIPLAEDPVEYIQNYYEPDVIPLLEYTDAQQADYQERIGEMYPDFQLTIGYSLGWDVLCGVMQYLPFTLGMALIVVLGNLFSQEHSAEMAAILRTTKNGRKKLLHKKLIAVIIIATGLWLIFQFAMLLAVSLTYTLQGGECTVMLFSGLPSFYGLTWHKFYLAQSLFSYFGTLVFALLVCCMSSLLKLRLSLPIQLVLTLWAGAVIDKFCYTDKAFGLMDKLRVLMPAQLMEAYPTLQVYQSYQLGSLMIPLPVMMAVAIVIEAAAMIRFLNFREGD